MGGTSTDVSLIQDGKPTISRQTAIGYYPIKVPSVDVHSVGAGGGSIAHVPMTGALRVGPESAGAVPGPPVTARAGSPTVTDANVVLGRLPPRLLGGRMVLDAKAAEEAVAKIARAMSLDLHQAAQGILDIVNENMLGALRLVTVKRARSRDFALVAFGGAGPFHGNAMAILAGCYPAIMPPTPGVLSALGLSLFRREERIRPDFVRDHRRGRSRPDRRHSRQTRTRRETWLREEGIDEAAAAASATRPTSAISARATSFRSNSIRIGSAAADSTDLAARFGLAHERIYGFKLDQPVELVNLRAVGVGAVQKITCRNSKGRPRSRRGGNRSASRLFRWQLLFRSISMIAQSARRQSGPRPGHRRPDGRDDRHPSKPHWRSRRISEYPDPTRQGVS